MLARELWSRFGHVEFLGAALLATIAIIVSLHAVGRGAWVGATLFGVVMSLMVTVLWLNGVRRWHLPPTTRLAWALGHVRRVLGSRPLLPYEEGRVVVLDEETLLHVDFLVYGARRRGMLMVGTGTRWSGRSEEAARLGEALRTAKEALDADEAVLWLPAARFTDWRTRLWPHLQGIRVLRGGPWKLRRLVRRWHSSHMSRRLGIGPSHGRSFRIRHIRNTPAEAGVCVAQSHS